MGADAKPRRHDGVAVLTRSRSQASTIFARNVSAAGSERDRVMAKRRVRSSLDSVEYRLRASGSHRVFLRSGYPKPMQ